MGAAGAGAPPAEQGEEGGSGSPHPVQPLRLPLSRWAASASSHESSSWQSSLPPWTEAAEGRGGQGEGEGEGRWRGGEGRFMCTSDHTPYKLRER